MKTLLLSLILIIVFTFQFQAQTLPPKSKPAVPLSDNTSQVGVPAGRRMPAKTKVNSQGNRHTAPTAQSAAVLIGTTTYDLQTNASGGNRIYSNARNVAATWTMSQLMLPAFSDRGTGYNYFDGINWSTVPSSAIDSLSWPSIDIGFGNTEYVVGHNKSPSAYDLVLLKRPAGSGNWTKTYLPPHPAGHYCQWSKMRVGGAYGATIHVIALTRPVANGGFLNNGIDGALTYSRSQDGGATWDLVHVALPLVDSVHYARMKADSYAIDVKDNVVAITQGSMFNDWVLWKSFDNGTSWTRTIIQPFPIAAYDTTSMSTDIDGDFVSDTLDVMDGSQAVLIDNNNMVHCWSGALRVIQDPGGQFIYFPFTDGLNYWNEGFLSFPPVSIANVEDIDLDGTIFFPEGAPEYGTGLTSMPTAGIDGGSTIIVAYSGMIENTTNGNPNPLQEQSYRNTYFLASTDNGQSWTDPVRHDPSDFDESVYPSIARNIGPEIHLIVQRDGEPGLNVTGSDPMGLNEIIYYAEDPAVLFNGVAVNPVHHLQMGGKVYFDQNQNGIKDVGEFNMMHYPLQLIPDNEFTETNSQGIYTFATDTGTHTINILNGIDWITTSDSSSYTITVDTLYYNNLDFGVYPTNSNYNVNAVITGGIPRCNNSITYWISCFNYGTTPTSGVIRFLKDPQLTFIIANPPVNYASADTFEWNFVNLMPFEQRNVSITVSSFGLAIGDTIFNCAEVLYDNGSTGGVSEDCTTQQIICSYDPNDKAVNPPGVGIPNYVLLTDTLVYTIRFQNTGNDTAFTVRVRDTLDAIVDPASFRLIASSHPVNVIRLNGNIVVFDFENILLPDSAADEPGSNGFVKYSVRPLPGTPVGTVLNNTAHIFFDYNPAIVTNTTSNTLVDVIGLNEHVSHEMKMLVYPNPVNDETTITFSNKLNGLHQLIIRDISGREIKRIRKVSGNSVVISAAGWTSGMYFIMVADGTGKVIGVEKLLVK